MKCNVLHIKKLLDALAQKTGVSLDRFGFIKMSEALSKGGTEISSRYLDETLNGRVRKMEGSEMITVQPHNVDTIAQHLGFKDFASFCLQVDSPIDPVLRSCVGSYYCYVRVNAEEGIVLRSPVNIYEGEGSIRWRLVGPHQQYDGEISYVDHCLFILMTSSIGKQFHHVYKIGRRVKPSVLKGIFSGVTTAFDPIGGRVLLIRQDLSFTTLTERKERIDVLVKSKLEEDKKIAQYFKEYSTNNLKLLPSRSFGLDDLEMDN